MRLSIRVASWCRPPAAGALALCLAGCSSSATTPPPTDAGHAADASQDAAVSLDAAISDAGAGDAPSADASDSASSSEAGGCSGLVDTASTVTEEYSATDPPAATGGTFLDGTYFLTASTVYTGTSGPTGPTGEMRRATLQLTGDAYLYSSDDNGVPYQQTGTIAPSGTTINGAVSCPSGKTDPFASYSITSTGFIEYAPNYSGTPATLAHTFTKQ
jgi:hypothetical protein